MGGRSRGSRSQPESAHGVSWGHPGKRRLVRGAIVGAMLVLLTATPAAAQQVAEASEGHVAFDLERLFFGKSWS